MFNSLQNFFLFKDGFWKFLSWVQHILFLSSKNKPFKTSKKKNKRINSTVCNNSKRPKMRNLNSLQNIPYFSICFCMVLERAWAVLWSTKCSSESKFIKRFPPFEKKIFFFLCIKQKMLDFSKSQRKKESHLFDIFHVNLWQKQIQFFLSKNDFYQLMILVWFDHQHQQN